MHKASRSFFLSLGSGALMLATAATFAPASAADLAGSWKGSGTVKFSSGATERARCRATFSPSGDRAYDVSATCATQSGTVSQTAFIRGRGSSYRGTFYNPEFDTTGKIQISVSGQSQVVRLNSNKGSAVIRLSR
ncbi:hypothetical protein [Hyphomicrobium sp.]|uniref:hypothetical protein n=1 Tax=Hyphomicrobium sp. TaxID=82 RepID=UPI0025C715E0|nr:hypothetical protein [Hyphomicrobium sp.]MCC7250365.1 hypothetical protein [Hyphomicrobium sp.]